MCVGGGGGGIEITSRCSCQLRGTIRQFWVHPVPPDHMEMTT